MGDTGGKTIERWRSANGQALVFNPQAAPPEVVEDMAVVFGYNPKPAAGCLADMMISQTKNVYPPVAFMLVSKKNRHLAIEDIVDRSEKARKAFQFLFAIIIENYPRLHDLQLLLLRRGVNISVFAASSTASAAKLIVALREKHSFQLTEKAEALYGQLHAELSSRDHALEILSSNLTFLTRDDCEMLLDVFGSLSRIIQATKDEILDNTVLNAEAAHAVEDFFRTEYTVE